MAETLGMLCDKLTIVKLKEYHTDNPERLESLKQQASMLRQEIDEFIGMALSGQIPLERLVFASNKVFKKEGNEVGEVKGNFGEIFYQLAQTNCDLWHEQEKVYEFEKVPSEEKDIVVKNLAILNLQRNKCIDAINELLKGIVERH